MGAIRTVALAGTSHFWGSGRLGPAILDQLLQHNFDVTVLTRHDSAATFPASAKVKCVDYSSKKSLISALQGQDAVVSAIATPALDKQLPLIDAAVEAGVRCSSPPNCCAEDAGRVCRLFDVRVHLHDGDYGPATGMGLDRGIYERQGKGAQLYDGGDRVLSTTTLPTVGKAVCSVLAHLAETENREVKVHDTSTTLNKLLAMAQRVVGEDGWTISKPSVEQLSDTWDGIKKGNFNWPTLSGFVVTASVGKDYGGTFESADNKLLGIPEMTEAELQAAVDHVAKHCDGL
ncbi:putative oxidoreductase-protein [Seiridium cardinale]|uniref:Oxidoreductase-protein n=1 Tax=Seiridium cardinale TaxID=138064 RepID=A0ABR2XN54_9PEZI